MTRALRLSAAVGLLAGLLAVPSAGAGASTPKCTAGNLYLSRVRSQAATGHRFWDLSLRNVASQTCHLRGFPAVRMLNAGAGVISVAVTHASGRTVRTVVLAPFHRAFFTFEFVAGGPCLPHSFSAFGLQVFPPGNTRRLRLFTGRFDVCSPSLGGNPQVTPVRRTLNGT